MIYEYRNLESPKNEACCDVESTAMLIILDAISSEGRILLIAACT